MKIKNYHLMDNTFIESFKLLSKLHIPFSISFQLDKCLQSMQKELEFLNKTREGLFKKYGHEYTDKNGNHGYSTS